MFYYKFLAESGICKLYRIRITYQKSLDDIKETYAFSIDEADQINQELSSQGYAVSIIPIDQNPADEWLDGMKFDNSDQVLIARNMGESDWLEYIEQYKFARRDFKNINIGEGQDGYVLTANPDGTVSFQPQAEVGIEGFAKQDLSNVKLAEDPSKKDYVLTLNADGSVSFQPQKEGGEGQSAIGIEFKTLALPTPILVNDSRIEQEPAELESKVLVLPKPIFIQDYQTIENFY